MDENNVSVHEKWIAGLIWLGLLGALVFSSVQLGAIVIALLLPGLQSALLANYGSSDESALVAIDYLTTIFYGGGALVLGLAWWRFADLSHQLLVALATDSSPFGILLYLPNDYLAEREASKSEEPLDLTRSNRSDVSIVVRYLGLSWVIFIIGATCIPFLAKLLD